MEQNPELTLAWQFVEGTGTHLFLTGKAGTGKTTFLRRLKSESPKRMVVLAPTGIAAINAGGVTIHSFFQLPLAPFVPETSFSADGKSAYYYRFSREKINIIRSIDLLVIDEISMVRADLLDAVDRVLRRYRAHSEPFGGVQLLMIGDLQQLAPVVKEEEWQLLKSYYDTPYFFSSRALQQTDYCTIELKTVYRQQDAAFLDLLNSIRENRCDDRVLALLNSRYRPGFHPAREEGYIRLVTHNYQAQRINESELQQLPGRSYTYHAQIEGKFPEYAYPTEPVLELKQGAQVMFIKNDSSGNHRYYNGLLGEVVEISSRGVVVRPQGGGEPFPLQEETWTNARYVLDETTKEIKEDVEGTFRQFPVKTAWAITIHKSQGLTFEHAIIDASASFAHGQAYVALSRCKTLEGLVLSAPLPAKAVISDVQVDDFTAEARRHEPDGQQFASLQRTYFLELLSGLFGFQHLEQALRHYVRLVDEYLYRLYPKQLAAYKDETKRFHEQVVEVAQKFSMQYVRLVETSTDYAADAHLQARIHQASGYFRECLKPLEQLVGNDMSSDNKEVQKKLRKAMDDLSEQLDLKAGLLAYVHQCGFQVGSYLKQKAVLSISDEDAKGRGAAKRERKKKADTVEVPSDILHPELYRQLVAWRREEAARLGLPAYTVFQQKAILGISNLLPEDKAALARIPYVGKKGLEKYGDVLLALVSEYRQTH